MDRIAKVSDVDDPHGDADQRNDLKPNIMSENTDDENLIIDCLLWLDFSINVWHKKSPMCNLGQLLSKLVQFLLQGRSLLLR